MSIEQKKAFLDRRARILKKHAAQDPDYQNYLQERRPRPLRLLFSVVFSMGLLAFGGKALLTAYHGPSGYAQLIAPLAEGHPPDGFVAQILAPDPATGMLADFLDGQFDMHRPVYTAQPTETSDD